MSRKPTLKKKKKEQNKTKTIRQVNFYQCARAVENFHKLIINGKYLPADNGGYKNPWGDNKMGAIFAMDY